MNEAAAPAPRKPRLRPRDAATLILVERKDENAKVLMGKRHESHKFMPGKFVFPGGRVEPADRRMKVACPLDPRVEAKLMARRRGATPSFARALALAAIRETFEETGIVIGADGFDGSEAPTPDAWRLYAQQKRLPDLHEMRFVARAITPPGRTKRFDTRFFVLDAKNIARKIDGFVHAQAELVELVWIDLKEAEQLDLPRITRRVLSEVRRQMAADFSLAAPVPFFYELYGQWRREEL